MSHNTFTKSFFVHNDFKYDYHSDCANNKKHLEESINIKYVNSSTPESNILASKSAEDIGDDDYHQISCAFVPAGSSDINIDTHGYSRL